MITYVQYGGMTLLACAAYAMFQPLVTENFSFRLLAYSTALFIAVAVFDFSPFIALLAFLLVCVLF